MHGCVVVHAHMYVAVCMCARKCESVRANVLQRVRVHVSACTCVAVYAYLFVCIAVCVSVSVCLCVAVCVAVQACVCCSNTKKLSLRHMDSQKDFVACILRISTLGSACQTASLLCPHSKLAPP